MQGWKSRIYPNFTVALRDDEAGRTLASTECSCSKTKGLHPEGGGGHRIQAVSVRYLQRTRPTGRLGRVRAWVGEQGDARRDRGRGRVVGVREQDALSHNAAKEGDQRVDTPAPMESAHVK